MEVGINLTNIKSDIKNSDYEKVENLNESIYISIIPGYQYYITPKIRFRISGTASLYQYFYKNNNIIEGEQNTYQYKNDFRQINSSLNFGFMMYLGIMLRTNFISKLQARSVCVGRVLVI